MEEFDFKVRWPSVRLLTGLLIHRPKEVQECVLVSPMGVSRLMDLLSDSREVIRNDVMSFLFVLSVSHHFCFTSEISRSGPSVALTSY